MAGIHREIQTLDKYKELCQPCHALNGNILKTSTQFVGNFKSKRLEDILCIYRGKAPALQKARAMSSQGRLEIFWSSINTLRVIYQSSVIHRFIYKEKSFKCCYQYERFILNLLT